ncbi:hypothetical protein [Bacillus sp. L27]|uniref:hypothetical protein n=1 Tax=Bacillus sp. L27 TaxID=1866312 RepID=UPI0008FE2808|nr:hypothetical protein [Bacillus sp. L27]OJD52840.1 hypothetical protein BAU24_06380 [Bacillus sp. L27]
MEELWEMIEFSILFILIVVMICFILKIFMFIFRKENRYNRSVEKELKQHASTKDNLKYIDSEVDMKNEEADWMTAVMTATFVAASMKSGCEHQSSDNMSEHDGHA